MARFPKNDIISLIGEMPRYDLGESVGPDLRLSDVLDRSAQPSFGEMALGYGTAQGDPRLRTLIADAHGVSTDDVVVTMGGMHALFLVAFVLCERGDEAVTVSPMFPLARNTLDAVGATIRTVSLSFDRGYQLDATDICRHLSERTRLVSLASPQNPSGVASSPKIIRDIVALMEERCPEAYLLLDETYREAAYGDDAVAPSAVGLSHRVVSCASLSKCHGAPRLRRCVRLKPSLFDNGAVDRSYAGLAREGVRVANGIWFGDEARVFRLGFGLLSKADREAALTHLSAAVHRISHAAV